MFRRLFIGIRDADELAFAVGGTECGLADRQLGLGDRLLPGGQRPIALVGGGIAVASDFIRE